MALLLLMLPLNPPPSLSTISLGVVVGGDSICGCSGWC